MILRDFYWQEFGCAFFTILSPVFPISLVLPYLYNDDWKDRNVWTPYPRITIRIREA